MQEHRRVLHGADILKDLKIDRSFYRAQVEQELRAKQIRLRQRAAELLSKSERLMQLLTDSISTFCVLGRHALILSGGQPRWRKNEIIPALADALKMQFPAANEILAIRALRKPPAGTNALSLLERYLAEMDALVQFVDGLDK